MPTKIRRNPPINNFQEVFKNRRIKETFTFRFSNGQMFYFKGDTKLTEKELENNLPTEFRSKSFFKRLDSRQV